MLTARQQEIWQFLVEYADSHGYPPTVREIGEAVGLASPSTVHAHLANLERVGLLKRDPSKPRALDLIGHRTTNTSNAHASVEELPRLPLLGHLCQEPAIGAPQDEHIQVIVIAQQVGGLMNPAIGCADLRPQLRRAGEATLQNAPQPPQFGRKPPFSATRSIESAMAWTRSWSVSPDAANGGRPSSVRALRTAAQ